MCDSFHPRDVTICNQMWERMNFSLLFRNRCLPQDTFHANQTLDGLISTTCCPPPRAERIDFGTSPSDLKSALMCGYSGLLSCADANTLTHVDGCIRLVQSFLKRARAASSKSGKTASATFSPTFPDRNRFDFFLRPAQGTGWRVISARIREGGGRGMRGNSAKKKEQQ